MMRTRIVLVAVMACAVTAHAQQLPSLPPPNSAELPHVYSSGSLSNSGTEPAVLDQHVIHVPNAPRLRVLFGSVSLGPNDRIDVVGLADGVVHPLDAQEMSRWRNTSCRLNGDTVRVELVVAPGSTASYSIRSVEIGLPMVFAETICFGTDDRTPSADPRVARFESVGCTIWLVGPDDCALSAGHCFSASGATQIAEFNPPPSLPSGATQSPPPQDQYPIDQSVTQFVSGGVGNDWGVTKLLPNFNGPAAPTRGFFQLDFTLPPVGTTIRVTGHGTAPGTLNQVQQTHTGPLVISGGSSGTQLGYQVDTTGGNSGSPVIDESTGMAVGIHTHGGCGNNGGNNSGTSLANASFQAAYNAVCNTTAPPIASFTVSDPQVIVGQPVSFTDTSFGVPTSWDWDFDLDGTTDSTAQNPTFSYAAPGSYSVRLTVTNALGSNTAIVPNAVTVFAADTGQPNVAAASFEIDGQVDQNGLVQGLGVNGPFFVSLAAGDAMTMRFGGPPNSGFLILFGPLNRGNRVFTGFGQLDLGFMGATNDFSDVAIVADGISGQSFFDALASTNAAGNQTIVLTVPALMPGIFGAVQAAVSQGPASVLLSAATEVTIL